MYGAAILMLVCHSLNYLRDGVRFDLNPAKSPMFISLDLKAAKMGWMAVRGRRDRAKRHFGR